MSQVLTTIFPVFALIALGFFMVKRGLFSQSGVDDLIRFIFYLAVPSLLFRTSASGIMAQRLELGIILGYFGVAIVVFFISYFLTRAKGHEQAVVGAMSGSFSNLALIGLPIVQTAYGQDALVPLMTLITFNAMVLFTLPCIMIETGRNPNANLFIIIKNGVISALTNPLVIALVSGWIFAQFHMDLPIVLDKVTELLSNAAAPCALFAVGGGMARYSLRLEETRAPVLIAAIMKLMIMPILVWLVCTYIIEASPLWTLITTLAAAMPTGANPFILATRYQTSDRVAGNAILITTGLALFSLSAFLLLFPPL